MVTTPDYRGTSGRYKQGGVKMETQTAVKNAQKDELRT
jgi:hypothetical protein